MQWKSTEGEGEKLLDTGETSKAVARLLRWKSQGRRDDSLDGRGVATTTALEPALATVLETAADLHKEEVEEEGRRRRSRRTLADDHPE